MAFRYNQVSEADTEAKSWHVEDGSLDESAGVRATSSLPCGTSAIHLLSESHDPQLHKTLGCETRTSRGDWEE